MEKDMDSDVVEMLNNNLLLYFNDKEIKAIINKGSFVTIDENYRLFHPDEMRTIIYEMLLLKNGSKSNCVKSADVIVSRISKEFEGLNYYIIDKWAVHIERQDCTDCPAYRRVAHFEGTHKCCLFFDIEEKVSNNGDYICKPVNKCLRPHSIGASYLVARLFNLPEPKVGKME